MSSATAQLSNIYNSTTLKTYFACLGAWKRLEGNGDIENNFGAIWDIKVVPLPLFRSRLCRSSASYELWTPSEGPREKYHLSSYQWQLNSTVGISPYISISSVSLTIQKPNDQGQKLIGRWGFIKSIQNPKGKVTKLS